MGMKKLLCKLMTFVMVCSMVQVPVFAEETQYFCGQEAHTHDQNCYLICEKTSETVESASGDEISCHNHEDGCYSDALICGKEAHAHTAECEEEPDTHQAHNTCGVANCTEDHDCKPKQWTAVTAEDGLVSAAATGGSVYLANDVELSEKLEIISKVDLCLNGYTLSLASNVEDSVICVTNSGTLNLCDCSGTDGTITGGKTSGSGGGVYNSGTFTMYSGSISGNTAGAGYNGGGVYNGGTFTMNGGSITDNEAEYGGGVDNSIGAGGDAIFTMNGGVISGNTADKEGGGVDNLHGTIIINGGEISGNTANTNGGGLCIFGNAATFTMNGGSISGNTANTNGGGVHIYSGSITMNGGSISGNTKSGSTTASNVYLEKDKKITVGESMTEGASFGITAANEKPYTFTTTVASDAEMVFFFSDDTGYAVGRDAEGRLQLEVKKHIHSLCGSESCTHTDCTKEWTAVNTVAELITAVGTDGSYYLTADIALSARLDIDAAVNLCLNGHVLKQTAESTRAILVKDDANFNLCDCSEGVTHYWDKDAESGLWTMKEGGTSDYKTVGGVITGSSGVYIAEGGTFTMYGGNISGNTLADSSGGGVCNYKGTFTMEGGSISGNLATGTDGRSGGGVWNEEATFIMNGGSISGNTATNYGGGVYHKAGTFTINGGEISGNEAKQSGGGVFSELSITMNDGEISGNTASSSGGGVYMKTGTTFAIKGGEISGNTAKFGAGVRGSIAMEKGEISDNTASSSGGGVYTSETGSISAGKISGNTAQWGGAVYIEKPENGSASFAVNGGEISGNTASKSGGVVYNKAATFTMKAGEISDNTAKWGGFAYNDAGIINVNGGEISGNTATSYGGGIYITNEGSLTMKGGTISNNTVKNSGDGGAVYKNSGTITMEDGVISGNTASRYGGGVYNGAGTFTMKNGEISGNTSNSYGGGVYNNTGTLKMENGTISGNKGSYGGGVYNNDGTITMENGTISGNTAKWGGGGVYNSKAFTMKNGAISGNTTTSNNGGGVYNKSSATFTMEDGTISDNTADLSGGGVFNSKGGAVTMKKGSISGNKAENGGGMYHGGTFNVEGGSITGNTLPDGTTASNVYVSVYSPTEGVLTVGQTLAAGASFGITGIDEKPLIFTKDAVSDAVMACFTPDNTNYIIQKAADGKLQLVEKHIHSLCGSESCTHTDCTKDWVAVKTEAALIAAATNGGSVYLTADIKLNTKLEISGKVDLCLNGKELRLAENATGSVIGVKEGAELNLCDCSGEDAGTITGGNADEGGGVSNYGTFTMYSGTISGNTAAHNGGGVFNGNGCSFTMSGGSISGNTAKQYGGGVFNNLNGKFTINDGSISGNTAATDGGGVFNNLNGQLTINGGAVINNTMKDGAAGNIYLYDNTKITVGGTLADGTRFGVSAYDKKPYIFTANEVSDVAMACFFSDMANYKISKGTDSKLQLVEREKHSHSICGNAECEDTDCVKEWTPVATAADLMLAVAAGGSYYLAEDIDLSVELEISEDMDLCLNNHVLKQTAENARVIIIAENVKFNLCDCSGTDGGMITGGNTDVYFGGGVYNAGDFTMYSGSISGNTSEDGGGVYSFRGAFTMNGGSISGNTAKHGGGVYNDEGTIIMNGGSISGNTSETEGGGVYNNGSFTLNGGTVIGNKDTDGTASNVYLYTDAKITVGETVAADASLGITTANTKPYTFTTNAATGDEIILCFFSDDANCVIKENKEGMLQLWEREEHSHSICGNAECEHTDCVKKWTPIATADELIFAAAKGGSYYLAEDIELSAELVISEDMDLCLNDRILQQTAEASVISIKVKEGKEGVTFQLCDCGEGTTRDWKPNENYQWILQTSGEGEVTTVGGVITGGNAANDGGGVKNNNGTFIMYSGNISGNIAKDNGGGVSNDFGTFIMYGGEISGNRSMHAGGGVENYEGTFTMHNGIIRENVAEVRGGGVLNSGNFTMEGGSISANTAYGSLFGSVSGAGGGVCSSSGAGGFIMNGGSISENQAVLGGGGVILARGAFEMNGGSITGNECNAGGGLMIFIGSAILKGGIISGNTNNGGTGISNVLLNKEKQLTIGETMEPDASFGIAALSEKPYTSYTFTTNVATDDEIILHFFSDNDEYVIEKDEEGKLQLIVKSDTPGEEGGDTPGTDTPVTPPSGGGGSSSGGSTPAANVIVGKTENGKVTVSPTHAEKGAEVTITATPDDGYEIGAVKVVDSDGKEVTVTEKGDGTYTFIKPGKKVTISVDFVKIEAEKAEEITLENVDRAKALVLTIDQKEAAAFGETVTNDVAPIIRNERTMLPIRFVAEALGGKVAWDGAERKVTITTSEQLIEIVIDSSVAYVNGKAVQLDAPAFIEYDRTYLPLRFVAEHLGATVLWDAKERQVIIVPKAEAAVIAAETADKTEEN